MICYTALLIVLCFAAIRENKHDRLFYIILSLICLCGITFYFLSAHQRLIA